MDGGIEPVEKKSSRSQRTKRMVIALRGEVTSLETLVGTLLDHLEAAIHPGLTDRERIRYRCMIQDIRNELNEPKTIIDRHPARRGNPSYAGGC